MGRSAIVASGFGELFLLDIAGDGFDLSGWAEIQAGDELRRVNWPAPQGDDAFLMVDADALAEAGITLAEADGDRLRGVVLISDAVHVVTPAGAEVVGRSVWHLLGAFDANADGKLSAADPTFPSLRLFHDGQAAAEEIVRLSDDGVSEIGLQMGRRWYSTPVSVLIEGTFVRTNGALGQSAAIVYGR